MSHDFVKPKKIGGLDTNTNAGQRSPFASRPFLATPRSQPQPQDIQTMRERAARYQAANPHLYGTSAQPQTVQRQASETEEESLQMKANESVQRKPEQPDLQTLIRQRAARVDTPLQRIMKVQIAEAQRLKQQEDEKLQTKSEVTVQREIMPEVEEENLQMQSEPTLQRDELSEEEEDKNLQMQSEATVQLKSQDSKQEQAEVQTKLTIGQPGDKYEQEADNMATKVMSMPDPTAQNVQRQEIGKKEETLQEKPLVDGITPVVQRQISETQQQEGGSQSLESQLAGEKGGGHPLSDEVRGFMEPRFGADFSDVRVHTGSAAVQMNQQLGAQAFTHGNDVYYGKGKAPGNDALTAHELTHTIQQASRQTQQSSISKPIQRDESEKRNEDQDNSSSNVKVEPSQNLKFAIKFNQEKGNHAWDFTITLIKKKGQSLVKGETKELLGIDNLTGRGEIAETEAALKIGKKIEPTLTAELAKVGTEYNPFPWLKIQLDLNSLEATRQNDKTEVDLASLSVNIEGTMPDEWLIGIGIPKALVDKIKVATIKGTYKYKVPLKDLAKLKRMNRAMEIMSSNAKAMKKKLDKFQKLADERSKLQKQIQNAQSSEKEILKKRINKINKKSKKLYDSLKRHKNIIKKASERFAGTAKNLKSRTGQIVGKALTKVGGKALRKIATFFFPTLFVISTVYDIVKFGIAIHDLATGRARLGGGGERSGNTNTENGEETSSSVESDYRSNQDSISDNDLHQREWTNQTTEDWVDSNSDLYSDVQDPYEENIELHDNSKRFLEAVVGNDIHLTPEHLQEINEIIPPELSDDEIQKVIDVFKQGNQAAQYQNADAFIGKLIHSIDNVQTSNIPEPNLETDVEQINYHHAAWVNLSEQKALSWTVKLMTGGTTMTADSREFADWVADYQRKKGIKVDGICGPNTLLTRLQELEMTDSPVFDKALKSLNYRLKQKGQPPKKASNFSGQDKADNPSNLTDASLTEKVEENEMTNDKEHPSQSATLPQSENLLEEGEITDNGRQVANKLKNFQYLDVNHGYISFRDSYIFKEKQEVSGFLAQRISDNLLLGGYVKFTVNKELGNNTWKITIHPGWYRFNEYGVFLGVIQQQRVEKLTIKK
ncbi:MAG: DUF4157 domain-containing protein [Crocosphaera sp.]|nr:DUF4157 domain-containing protein [Crocosphaera sp.]